MAGTKTSDYDIARTIELAKEHVKDDGSPNIRKIAGLLGVSRGTVRGRLANIENGNYEGFSLDKQAVGSESDLAIARLRKELRETRRQLSNATQDTLDSEAIKLILGNLAETSPNPPDWIVKSKIKSKDVHVPMTMWGDWHAGEVVKADEVNGINEFNTAILEERVQRLVEREIHLCEHWGPGNYPGMVINLVGDFISGELHPELQKTDELARIPATLFVRDLLVWALSEMADHFGKLFVPCVSGNHGRDTKKPEYKGYLNHNFDWLIYQLLERHFMDDKRVQFMIPDSNECLYKVFDHGFLLNHGDMLGATGGDGIIGVIGPIMRGGFKTMMQSASMGREYTTLLIGHYHQELWLPSVVVSNSLKGFDEYARLKLRAKPSTPSQPLWFEHPVHGSVSYHNVTVEEPIKQQGGPEWVSWAVQ